MAIALVQTGTALDVSGGTSGTITLTSVTAGDLLTVVVCDADANTVTFTVADDRGNSWTRSVGNSGPGGGRAEIWHCLSAAAGTTVITVTADSSTIFVAQAQEWSGGTFALDTSSAIDESATTSHVCSANATVIDTTTAALVMCCSGRDGITALGTRTPGSGYTEFNGVGTDFDRVHWQWRYFVTARNNVRGEFTSSSSRSMNGCIAAFSFTDTASGGCWWPCCGGATLTELNYVVGFGEFSASSPYYSNDVSLYLNDDDSWLIRATTTPVRGAAPAATIGSAVYFYGGFGTSANLTDNDEYVLSDAWTAKTDLVSPARGQHGGMTVGSYGYAVYGYSGSNLKDNDQYDPSGNSWASKTDGPTPVRLSVPSAGIGSKGYTFGGYNSGGLPDTEEYDPAGDTWTSKTDMPVSTTQWEGGFDLDGYGYAVLATVYQFSPGGNSWSTLGARPSGTNTNCANESLNSASVGYMTAGWSGVYGTQHQEYTPDAWTLRASLPSPGKQFASAGYVS